MGFPDVEVAPFNRDFILDVKFFKIHLMHLQVFRDPQWWKVSYFDKSNTFCSEGNAKISNQTF